jgi:hypothetical protein
VEVLVIVAIIPAFTVPIEDYALREYLDWQAHPSSQSYRVFIEKQEQEEAVRLLAVPAIAVAVIVAGVLHRHKRKRQ